MIFTGKTVVVTGASMGIGRAIAQAFASEGAHVVMAARNKELLDEAASAMGPFSQHVRTVHVDVTSDESVARLAAESLSFTGTVDVLVNNAGIGLNGAIAELDLAAFRQCLEVNLVGAVRVAQSFQPALTQSRGTLVQISSVLGKVSVPFTGGYNASKHALNAISDALRLEMASKGVHVVSVYPGSTETPFRQNSLGAYTEPKVRPHRVSAERVAQRVVRAVRRNERDVYVTWKDALLCWSATRWPRLADRILTAAYGLR